MAEVPRNSRRERLLAVAGPCESAQTDRLRPLLDLLRARFGDKLVGIVYYGACLRDGDPYGGLIDFYVIVDSYGPPGQCRLGAFFNRTIPPNVYYAERETENGTLRCKYAVLSIAQLETGVARGFQSSIWGRFAQPVALVHTRSDRDAERIRLACGEAVATLLRKALPSLADMASPLQTFAAADLFAAALTLSYASELRVEQAARSRHVVGGDAGEYARRLQNALPLLPFDVRIDNNSRGIGLIPAGRRRIAKISWPARRISGKLLSIVRLIKACFTFVDAVDYAAFKIERHTGVAIDVTDRLRRHPLVFGWVALWRVYRRRLLR